MVKSKNYNITGIKPRGLASFSSVQSCVSYTCDLLRNSRYYKRDRSALGIFSVYAPRKKGSRNNPVQYAENVVAILNSKGLRDKKGNPYTIQTQLDLNDPQVLEGVLQGIARQEGRMKKAGTNLSAVAQCVRNYSHQKGLRGDSHTVRQDDARLAGLNDDVSRVEESSLTRKKPAVQNLAPKLVTKKPPLYTVKEEEPSVIPLYTVKEDELPPWETDGVFGIPREESIEKPNFFQRYLPKALGGWSREKIQDVDMKIQEISSVHKNQRLSNIREGHVVPTWWQRNAFSWLGGWSQEEKLAFHSYRRDVSRNVNPNEKNILEFVSERDLIKGGLSSEHIAQLKNYIKENSTERLNINDVFKNDKEAVKKTTRVYHEQLGAATRLALHASSVDQAESGLSLPHDQSREV